MQQAQGRAIGAWWAFLFFAAVLVVTLGALVLRWWPRHLEESVTELLDGDADRPERLACLAVIRTEGLARLQRDHDLRAGLLAAMAAVLLDDEAAYQAALRGLAGQTPFLPGGRGETDKAVLEEISLAEPHLRELLLGHVAENQGRKVEAKTHYERARISATLYAVPMSVRLADAGLARLR